jgi:hypothetical protein
MKSIINTKEKSIEIVGEPDVYGVQLDFCFSMDGDYVDLTGTSFGYELKKDSTIISSNSYPPNGLAYIRTDVELVTSETLDLIPGETYSLSVWCEIDDLFKSSDYIFTTKFPESPFESWIWDAEQKIWKAPTPYPEDGADYTWNEETTNWILIPEPS